MKVVISLTKNVSAPLGITTAASAIYARIKKKYTVLVVLHSLRREQKL